MQMLIGRMELRVPMTTYTNGTVIKIVVHITLCVNASDKCPCRVRGQIFGLVPHLHLYLREAKALMRLYMCIRSVSSELSLRI